MTSMIWYIALAVLTEPVSL